MLGQDYECVFARQSRLYIREILGCHESPLRDSPAPGPGAIPQKEKPMGQLAVNLSTKIDLLTKAETKDKTGIAFPRYFTSGLAPGKTPYDEIQWETRTASIGNDKGSVIFEQRDVDTCRWTGRRPPPISSPANTSTARWGRPSAKPASPNWCERVVDTIADWGQQGRLLQDPRGRAKISATNWPT